MSKSTQEHQPTDTAGRRARILGSLRAADGTGVVRVEDRYDAEELMLSAASGELDVRQIARWLAAHIEVT